MNPIRNRTFRYASAALAAMAFAACENGTGGTLGQGQIDADLKELSAKVESMSGPMPSRRDDAGAALKRAAGDCLFDGSRIDEWIDTVDGKVSIYRDTSDSYTAAGKLQCGEDDVVAYTISKSYNRADKWESWIHSRMDFPPPPADFGEIPVNPAGWSMKFSATGRVHYFSDYDIEIARAEAEMDGNGAFLKFEYLLKLEGGRYEVVLKPAPAFADLGVEEPDPATVLLSGPITHGKDVVGYFEILGDDSVVIKNAEKKIVSTH